ncbi:MAG: alkaline phosphatase family protein [Oscillospiraceae bacterium]|nr:alkaline phosphatase family protein [Oscillospiraceae bacterium]
MQDRYVVVLSADAMVFEDLEELSRLYAVADIWDRAARVERVQSIYPTITYPCHTTMMTGLYPDRHGVLQNEMQQLCTRSNPWQHMRSSARGKTIFDRAKENGLTTASVFWPVTGRDPHIDYLIDEYWPQHGESSEQCFRDSGTSEEVMEKIVRPNLKLIENRHRQHPWADAFVMQCACDMLTAFKPNLLMIHPANIDGYRHQTGLFSPKVTSGLHETNLWLSQLMKAADDAGILDKTDFFLVSDHGQMNIRRCIALNVLLAEKGLIDVDEAGHIRDWTAFAKSGGMSALVYLKHPDDADALRRTQTALEEIKATETAGIGEIFTEEEARTRHHLGGPFSFVVETDGYTTFSNDWIRPLVRPQDNSDYRFGMATHGYLPEKGPQPTLIAWGPHMKPGALLKRAYLVDEAPTFARALGIELPDTDGRCLDELFAEE